MSRDGSLRGRRLLFHRRNRPGTLRSAVTPRALARPDAEAGGGSPVVTVQDAVDPHAQVAERRLPLSRLELLRLGPATGHVVELGFGVAPHLHTRPERADELPRPLFQGGGERLSHSSSPANGTRICSPSCWITVPTSRAHTHRRTVAASGRWSVARMAAGSDVGEGGSNGVARTRSDCRTATLASATGRSRPATRSWSRAYPPGSPRLSGPSVSSRASAVHREATCGVWGGRGTDSP